MTHLWPIGLIDNTSHCSWRRGDELLGQVIRAAFRVNHNRLKYYQDSLWTIQMMFGENGERFFYVGASRNDVSLVCSAHHVGDGTSLCNLLLRQSICTRGSMEECDAAHEFTSFFFGGGFDTFGTTFLLFMIEFRKKGKAKGWAKPNTNWMGLKHGLEFLKKGKAKAKPNSNWMGLDSWALSLIMGSTYR